MDNFFETRQIPDYIGPYKIESLLEKGGMSYLYLGTHPETREPTTVKVLSPKFVRHPEVVRRFLNEAEIIAMADHPNIVKLYGHGEWEGGLYIAMEFIQGISLRQYILQTPLSLKKSLEMLVDIAYALCHLHTHGVIHRDLKPENILVSDSGVLKVIDFGIAQLLTEGFDPGKSRQSFIGTPIYMSPEQRDNPEGVGYPSDIYSLGIIGYELILGKLSLGQVHLSLVPKGLQKIFAKALQPKPEDRYQDIVDFITDITSYLHSNAVEKEKLAGDHLSELSDNLKDAYKALYPPPPIWNEVECAYVNHKIGLRAGGFFDFFTLPDGSHVVLAAEAVAEGVKGIIYSAVMRGMAKGIAREAGMDKEAFVSAYQKLLCSDPMDSRFAFALVVFHPGFHRFSYLSCGYGVLSILSNDLEVPVVHLPHHPMINIEPIPHFRFMEAPLGKGDVLVFTGYPMQGAELHKGETPPFLREEWWINAFQESSPLSLQKRLETAYRRAKAQGVPFLKEQAVNFLAFHRK